MGRFLETEVNIGADFSCYYTLVGFLAKRHNLRKNMKLMIREEIVKTTDANS